LKKVIHILGSGPMGLGVAFYAIKKGYKPIIYEADDRIGGMTASFDFNGLNIERFYHFHCKTDHDFFNILDELNLSKKFNWKNTRMGFWYKDRIHSWAGPIDLLKFPYLSIMEKIRYAINAFISTKRTNWLSLDQVSAEMWLRKSIGNHSFDILWKKLFNLKFYEYSDKVSAAWIWSRIKRTGLSRKNIFTEQLGYLENGSQTLLNAMQAFILNNGGEIHLSTPVQKVSIKNNKVMSFSISGKKIKAENIISTIPIPYIPKIIPQLPKKILASYKKIKNIGVVCVIVKLKKKITDHFWLNINDDDMDIPGIIEYSNLRTIRNCSIAYIPFYMPQNNPKFKDSDNTFNLKVRRYIKEINPNINDSDFLDIKINRYYYSQPVCEINHSKILPDVKLPIQGLYVADTSFYYPEDRGISESIKFGKKLINDYF